MNSPRTDTLARNWWIAITATVLLVALAGALAARAQSPARPAASASKGANPVDAPRQSAKQSAQDSTKNPTKNQAADAASDSSVKSRPASHPNARPNARPLPAFTPEREAAVFSFVERQHRELGQLLQHLKRADRGQYEQAVRQLFRTSERLAQIYERDPERHELERELWQVRSRAQLLSARLKIASDQKQVAALRKLLERKIELELAILERDRLRQQDRLEKIEQQIARKKATREAVVDRQVRILSQDPKTLPASAGCEVTIVRQAGETASRRHTFLAEIRGKPRLAPNHWPRITGPESHRFRSSWMDMG